MDTVVAVAAIASPAVALLVGAGQCGLIWWGLSEMRKAAEDRTRQVDAQVRMLDKQGKALEELLKRTESRQETSKDRRL